MRFDIAVFDGFDDLDVVGPLEVLRSAAAQRAPFDVRIVDLEGGPWVAGAYGTWLVVDGVYQPGADVLIVPGGGWVARAPRGAWAEASGGRWRPLLREAAASPTVLAGVCTGGMILADAGLLENRRATTHRGAWSELEAAGARLIRERVVDDGDLVTCGGVTSGIDLALWLVQRFAGSSVADAVAERLEYRRVSAVTL